MRLRRRSSIFSHLFRCFCSLRSNVYFRRRTFLFLLRFWHLIIIAQNLVPEWLMCLQWQTGERCKLQKPVRNVKTTNSAKLHIANRKHDLVLLFIIICSTYQQPNVGHIILLLLVKWWDFPSINQLDRGFFSVLIECVCEKFPITVFYVAITHRRLSPKFE